jgi:mono/diheme cytochrome c family protein
VRTPLVRHARAALPIAKRTAARAVRALGALVGIALAAAVLILIAGGALVWSGWYNVAAIDAETRLGGWLFQTTMRRSVQRRAQEIVVPPPGGRSELIRGAFLYSTSCEACHRGPGVARPRITVALSPEPADLAHTAASWHVRELYWIVKHGVRMSGMPAWRDIYSEDDIWAIVSFVSELPGMTAAEYQEYQRLGSEAHTVRKQ